MFPINLDILIVSAKYGVITPNVLIEDYDQIMTTSLALCQRNDNVLTLRSILQAANYDNVLICAGQVYQEALKPYCDWIPANVTMVLANGTIGIKLRKLKQWVLNA